MFSYIDTIQNLPVAQKRSLVKSIKEMKDLIIQAIDIDKFITFQNGDLITSFANPTLDTEKQVNVNNIRRPSSSAKISNTNIL